MKLIRSESLLLLTAVFALLHHMDHVLRVDHSGWPFAPQMTPFTFSLLIYPIFLWVFLAKSRPWGRVWGVAVLFLFATFTHTFLETPMDQYRTWSRGSDFPGFEGQHNLLGLDSQFLGVLAMIVTVLLSLTLLAALLAFINDARRGSSRIISKSAGD